MTFDHLTIDQGLSNNSVYTITEDRDGFVWLGTRDGLNRYDGYEFKVFKNESIERNDLPGNQVLTLFSHPEGDIWIGLQSGGLVIFEWDKQAINSNPFPDKGFADWSDVSVTSVFRDSKGYMWVGTARSGIIRFDSTLQHFDYFGIDTEDPARKLESNTCFSFVEDANNKVWMGVSGNQLHYYDHTTDSVNLIKGSPHGVFNLQSYSKALLYFDGLIWIGTQGSGLKLYDPDKTTFVAHFLENSLIEDLAIFDGRVFVATDGEGLYIFDSLGKNPESVRFQPAINNSLNTNALYDVFFDHSGNCWIGTFNGGVNLHKMHKTAFFSFSQAGGQVKAPGYQSTLSFCEDHDGNIWIGKDGGGLLFFDPASLYHQSFTSESMGGNSQLSSSVITSIFEDSEQNLWVGTFNNGLNLFNPKTGTSRVFKNDVADPGSLSNNNVWSIAEDPFGNLWIGTLGGGLNLLDRQTGKFNSFQPADDSDGEDWAISDRNIRYILPDPEGNLWIATEYGGLNFYDAQTGRFSNWKHNPESPSSISSNSILSLWMDAKKNLWIGTEGGGLNKLAPEVDTFIQFSVKEGFPSDVINAIEEDVNGILWISTNQGLVSFNPESQEIITFDKNDGLQSNQFNPGASLKTSTGKLFFGGINGFNYFEPEKVKRNPLPPRVVFTDFKLFNQQVPVGNFGNRKILHSPLNQQGTVSLDYSDNVFTVTFAALDYTNPYKNMYAYRMEGFDEKWNYVSADQRSITYTNLDAGIYRFQVKASNNNGVWCASPSTLAVKIHPPFWLTWWFQSLVFLSVVGLTATYLIYLDGKRQAAHKEKLLKAEQEILKLRNARLNEEVMQKNAQLSAAILQSAHKNKSLDQLKKQLVDLGKERNPDQNQKKEVGRIIHKIESELTTEDYWEQFQLNFDQVHQQFSRKILQKHPALTPNEIRLCCLLRINLSNKEIATIQNVSLGAIEKSKFRIKKKLALPKDLDLNTYILNFS